MAILISDKRFQSKKQKNKGTLYNDKKANPSRRYSNPDCVYTKPGSCKMCEAKSDRTEWRNKSATVVGNFNIFLNN